MQACFPACLTMKNRFHYPPSSYQRLYDPIAGPLWSPAEGLAPEEDGDHYSHEQDFFEWWYFDATFDNGYRLVAILHSSLFNAVDHKPTIDLRITPPSGPSVVAIGRYDRSDYQATDSHCDVRIASCHAVLEERQRYRLSLHQGDLQADLVYETSLPGWRPGTGYLFADQSSGHFFKWVVPLPYAHVAGTLSVQGERMWVTGYGYHDHNWGNFRLGEAFDHWYWGRILSHAQKPGWSIVFGDVVGRSATNSRVRPFLVIADGRILHGKPTLEVDYSDQVVEPTTGVHYPEIINLQARFEEARVGLSLCGGRVIEALDFASPPFRRRWPRQLAEIAFYLGVDKPLLSSWIPRLLGKGSYLRLLAKANASVHFEQETSFSGEAIYEVMQF
jgi:hypothetical protein